MRMIKQAVVLQGMIMTSPAKKLTRGNGLLESYLAQMRAQKANRLIPLHLRSGRILDIGCGSYPYFLAHTTFKEKFSIDQSPLSDQAITQLNISSYTLDLNSKPSLPFEDGFFEVITLLAVVEHLDPQSMARLFSEIHRTLCPGGVIILTTPGAWSAGLLNLMARIRLVSMEEINEHVYAYTLPLVGWYFGQAGFEMRKIRFGYFEAMLNMWAVAEK
jgi:SAM-dependent methyltransferase